MSMQRCSLSTTNLSALTLIFRSGSCWNVGKQPEDPPVGDVFLAQDELDRPKGEGKGEVKHRKTCSIAQVFFSLLSLSGTLVACCIAVCIMGTWTRGCWTRCGCPASSCTTWRRRRRRASSTSPPSSTWPSRRTGLCWWTCRCSRSRRSPATWTSHFSHLMSSTADSSFRFNLPMMTAKLCRLLGWVDQNRD